MGHSETNKKSIEEIDSSLFVLCLDDIYSRSEKEFSLLTLMGNGNNRYYDKLQLIVTTDGQAAFNMEHTGYDGQVLARFMIDAFNDAVKKTLTVPDLKSKLPNPHPLPVVTSPVRSAISKALTNWNEFIALTDLAVSNFTEFGKETIKNFKIPPDAFLQAAAQVATFKTLGKLVSTYESSSVRNYQHGRTETIRPLTPAMHNFVQKFLNPAISPKEKLAALHEAAKQHQAVVKRSKTGEGVDRHLQGLYWTALQKAWRIQQYTVPSFFTDGNYSNYMSNKLSTSNVGGDLVGIKLFGFGAVHGEGLGLGYLVNSNSLVTTITSYTGKSNEFASHLEQVYREMIKLGETK